MRNYGLKALLCTRKAFPHTTRIQEVNSTWAEPFDTNANSLELRLELLLRCLRGLKRESTFV